MPVTILQQIDAFSFTNVAQKHIHMSSKEELNIRYKLYLKIKFPTVLIRKGGNLQSCAL